MCVVQKLLLRGISFRRPYLAGGASAQKRNVAATERLDALLGRMKDVRALSVELDVPCETSSFSGEPQSGMYTLNPSDSLPLHLRGLQSIAITFAMPIVSSEQAACHLVSLQSQ